MTAVCDVFSARQREAAAQVAACEQRLDDARARLAELQNYRLDYARRLAGGNPGGANSMVELSVFISRLDTAVAALQRQIVDLVAQRDRSRRDWLESRRREKAVSQARDRFAAGERLDEERREQLDSDAAVAARRPQR